VGGILGEVAETQLKKWAMEGIGRGGREKERGTLERRLLMCKAGAHEV